MVFRLSWIVVRAWVTASRTADSSALRIAALALLTWPRAEANCPAASSSCFAMASDSRWDRASSFFWLRITWS